MKSKGEQLDELKHYHEGKTKTNVIYRERFVLNLTKRTLQATSKLSLAGRFGPFCK